MAMLSSSLSFATLAASTLTLVFKHGNNVLFWLNHSCLHVFIYNRCTINMSFSRFISNIIAHLISVHSLIFHTYNMAGPYEQLLQKCGLKCLHAGSLQYVIGMQIC